MSQNLCKTRFISDQMAPLQTNKIDPQKYYRDILRLGVRPDGRSLNEFRTVSINVKSLHNADGSAIVKIGNTGVVCGIKAELSKPRAETPDCGYLVANVELSPLCSSLYQPGPPGDYAQEAAKFLDETLRNCNCIDLRELCIVRDELVWVLHLDVICINQDGSLLDACVAAAVSALQVVILPHVTYDIETGVKRTDTTNSKSLTLLKFPVATTFAVFENNQILMDPTSEEETFSTGSLTVIVEAKSGKIFGIHQPGNDPISQDNLQNCIDEAKKKTKYMQQLVQLATGDSGR